MNAAASLFVSSGDLIADRRYQIAHDLAARGDLAAAAELLDQAVERAPAFASAWFSLGEMREAIGELESAISAYRQALACDSSDRHGAALHLARLGAVEAADAMSPDYVRCLFDQYAPRFDRELVEALHYRAPALLRSAIADCVAARNGAFHFPQVVDLGCGTGLMAQALPGSYEHLAGVDLSPAMVEMARQTKLYDELVVDEMATFLSRQADSSCDLIVAADSLVYVADLMPVFTAVARALKANGLFAFTVESHEGAEVILGEKLRFAHSAAHLVRAVQSAGLTLVSMATGATRSENHFPVPSLIVVTERHPNAGGLSLGAGLKVRALPTPADADDNAGRD